MKRIKLVAQGIPTLSTGYYYSQNDNVQKYTIKCSPEDLERNACKIKYEENLWMVPCNESEPSVPNTICLALTDKNIYDSVKIMKYDSNNEELTYPTIEELSEVLSSLLITYSSKGPAEIELYFLDQIAIPCIDMYS